MNDNKTFWQRFAKLYGPFMERGNRQVYEQICAEVGPFLNREMELLELACGSGQLSLRLASKVKRWEATDFSENMIAEARKRPRPQNLRFSTQDATHLPYAAECFDAVMIANALHIMPAPDRAMAEIFRVLKQNGLLFAPTFVHGEGAGFSIRIRLMSLLGFKTYSKWNAVQFAAYLERQGFEVTKNTVMGSNLAPLCCLIARKKARPAEEPR